MSQKVKYVHVYHYAPWSYLPRIVAAGQLTCSAAGAEGEKPLLWFSAHQHWEPTATKIIRVGGALRQLTQAEQESRFGCVRFGLAADDRRLLGWDEACSYAGTSEPAKRQMEATGRALGADHVQWFASPDAIQLTDLSFEILAGTWRPADPQQMAQVWAEVRG